MSGPPSPLMGVADTVVQGLQRSNTMVTMESGRSSSVDGQDSEPAEPPTTPKVKSAKSSMYRRIRTLVENYLSRENLSTDCYLVSHMNSDMWLPISVVLAFNEFRAMGQPVAVFFKALHNKSDSVEVDPERGLIRPKLTLPRNTVVLRDIPHKTPEQEIYSAFDDESCDCIVSVYCDESDNSWSITFQSEDGAQRSFDYIKSQTFAGAPINASLETESLIQRSGGRDLQGRPSPGANMFSGWSRLSPVVYSLQNPEANVYNFVCSTRTATRLPAKERTRGKSQANAGPHKVSEGDSLASFALQRSNFPPLPSENTRISRNGRRRKGQQTQAHSPNLQAQQPKDFDHHSQDQFVQQDGKQKQRRDNRSQVPPMDYMSVLEAQMQVHALVHSRVQEEQLTPEHPPSPSSSKKKESRAKASDFRYSGDYVKYSRSKVISVIRGMTDLSRPPLLPTDNAQFPVLANPHSKLPMFADGQPPQITDRNVRRERTHMGRGMNSG